MRFARALVVSTLLGLLVGAGPAAAARPDLVGTRVAVGDARQGPVVGEGAVWVASEDGLSRVDPATGAISRTTPLPFTKEPGPIAAGEGAVWVLDPRGGALRRVDPATGAVGPTAIPVPGGTALAAGLGAVWVLNRGAGTATRVDPVTGGVGPVVAVGADPSAVAIGEGAVWVADQAAHVVVRLDPATGAVQAVVKVGEVPNAVATGAGGVWVVDLIERTVSHVSPATNAVVATIPLDGRRSRTDGTGEVAVGAGAVWVDGGGAGLPLHRIDPATDRVTGRFSPFSSGSSPVGLAADAEVVWASPEGELLRIPVTPRVAPGTLVTVGGEPRGLVAGRTRVWLVDRRKGVVRRLSRTTARQVGRPIRMPRPLSVATTRDLVVTTDRFGVLTRIREGTGRILSRTVMGGLPQSLALGGGAAWVVIENNALDGTLVGVDLGTGRIRSRTPLGLGTGDVTFAAGRVWAVGEDLVGVDPRTGRVVSRPGRFVAELTALGASIVASSSAGVELLDARTGRPRDGAIVVGTALGDPAIAPGGVLLYPDFEEGTLAPVTTRGGTLGRPLPTLVGNGPFAAAIVGDEVWVTLSRQRAVRRIPLSSLGL